MSIFREYDIRGIVGKDLTVEIVESIGRAYATLALEQGCKTIAVGRDGRLTSSELRDRLTAGICSTGLNVMDIGVCATPLLYFSLFNLPVDGGVMITGSHNPKDYNGLKVVINNKTLFIYSL